MLAVQTTRLGNASRVLASCEKDYLRYIRVFNKTANITNGHLLIRRYMDLPDGFYQIGFNDTVIPAEPRFNLNESYPDIEAYKPPFERLASICQLSSEAMGYMKQFCDEAHEGYVYIDKQGLQHEQALYSYPFNLPVPIRVNSKYLGIALVELSQYQQVNVLKDPENYESPLIMGVNWGSCVLLMPMTRLTPTTQW